MNIRSAFNQILTFGRFFDVLRSLRTDLYFFCMTFEPKSIAFTQHQFVYSNSFCRKDEKLAAYKRIEANHIKMSICKFVYRKWLLLLLLLLCQCMRKQFVFGGLWACLHMYVKQTVFRSSTHSPKCTSTIKQLHSRWEKL